MWFCPTRQRWRDANDVFRSHNGGREIEKASDLVEFYRSGGAPMAALDMFWWIPRTLEGLGTMRFPDPQLLKARISDPWPASMETHSAWIQPIASDWLMGRWDSDRRTVKSASGGHTFGGKIRSNNAAFVDGRVETRPYSAVQWQYVNNKGDGAYLY